MKIIHIFLFYITYNKTKCVIDYVLYTHCILFITFLLQFLSDRQQQKYSLLVFFMILYCTKLFCGPQFGLFITYFDYYFHSKYAINIFLLKHFLTFYVFFTFSLNV